MNRHIKQLLFIFLLFSCSTSHAAMIVQQSVLYFKNGDPNRQDVEITNPDSEPLYINVELLHINNPGAENEERVTISNPKEVNFLVTPAKMIIKPNQSKRIRLVNLAPLDDKEKVFRINLTPVSPKVTAETTGVKVLIGYQLLAIVQPKKTQVKIDGKREGKTLTLSNNGNTNVLVQRGKQCQSKDENAMCEDLLTKRLYPGLSVDVPLPFEQGPISYMLSSGLNNQAAEY